ncbi:MAG: hypothetical protein PSV16_00515 [Flavobacterium sp.]|nr:hypothetical protein [Flavobacterium sp.]
MKFSLPETIDLLPMYRQEVLSKSLTFLYNSGNISGVLLGGSVSYKKDIEKSDVDLFCLMEHNSGIEDIITHYRESITEVDTVIFQGFFPWTQNLYTVYFKNDNDFSLDIGFISIDSAESFFWEPDGHVLFDSSGLIEKSRRIQMSKPEYTKQPFLKSNPFTMAVISIKKIDKNLSREHLWNAIEQVKNLRGYLMQVVRLYVIKDTNFLGRVDREIEDVMPEKFNKQFSETLPTYNTKDIAAKAILLSNIGENLIEYIAGTKEDILKNWILKHLSHEKEKLVKYLA